MPIASNSSKFRFTETEPTTLVKDFDTFVQYLEQNSFALGKASESIPFKHLIALNEAMSFPNTENTPRTRQEYYPQLHLNYHLAFAGKLFHKYYHKTQVFLEATERLTLYRALSGAEKYFFLLETLWVDCSWKNITNKNDPLFFDPIEFFRVFRQYKPDEPISAKSNGTPFRILYTSLNSFFIQCFSLFGWYKVVRDEQKYLKQQVKYFLPVASLTPSALGITIVDLLLKYRPFSEWNIPYRRSMGILPTSKESREKASIQFIEPFRQICANDELRFTLPRIIHEVVHGNFIFKVSVASKIWRKIAISSEHTLDDMHHTILNAFDFDHDHLYAFYMDNRWYSDESFESPLSERGLSAADVKIGELGLQVNQRFIYHYDFGDDWCFDVQLLRINRNQNPLKKPKIFEKYGEAPEQYPNFEW